MAAKKPLFDAKQRSLFSVGFNSEKSSNQPPIKEKGSSSDSKVPRSFQNKWLQAHKWLKFDTEKQLMFCTLCINDGRDNIFTQGCNNFRTSTFSDHVKSKDHQRSLAACKDDFKSVMNKHFSAKEEAVLLALKTVYYLVEENIPLSKFKSLVEFQKSVGVSGYNHLSVSDGISYESDYAGHEFLKAVSDTVETHTVQKLQKSPFVTLLCDESTDRTVTHRLVIYCQVLGEDMFPETLYLCNIRLDEGTGAAISSALYKELEKRGIGPEKIMGLGTDGASAMTGRDRGTTGMMLRQNPHIMNVQCIAHRLALCTSQASDSVPPMKAYQEVITSIFYYFKFSAARVAKLQAIQDVLDSPRLRFKEVHAVRWMSFFSALEAVYKGLDPLITYLAATPMSDAKAQGLKKKIATLKFISITYIMMDIIPIVTQLNLFFQKEITDVALVKVKIDQTLSDLQQLISTPGCHEQKLAEVITDTCFKEHIISQCPKSDIASAKEKFITALVNNIEKRFPDTDLLSSFGVLSMRPITLLSDVELKTWGDEKIDILVNHFGEEKSHKWKVDGVQHTKTSSPIIDPDATKNEWKQIKILVKAEMYPRDDLFKLWHLINKFHGEQFPNLLILASLAIICPVNTAGCERGFSVQNQTLTALRNRLNPDTQDQIMRIRINGKPREDFPFEDALKAWKAAVPRKLFN
ncbi:uncharacterized protein C17orf113-like [Ruditapes philippinarum]|uniref:uncharacterized protein C17orf113-like n=1 Tax=Ruditapes philippinarum TaxID=129788 RepID=UPI00295A84E6|nr:uncharacterized protein C17orf113-like [Ruditapes philippinarum]